MSEALIPRGMDDALDMGAAKTGLKGTAYGHRTVLVQGKAQNRDVPRAVRTPCSNYGCHVKAATPHSGRFSVAFHQHVFRQRGVLIITRGRGWKNIITNIIFYSAHVV